jgi:predicted DNA-binding transcriptional regulator AlpA
MNNNYESQRYRGDYDKLMTAAAVSEYLSIAESTLALYRMAGTGPKFIKVLDRMVRYRRRDVDEWLDAQTKTQNGAMPYSA